MAKKTLYILSVIFLIISFDNLIGIYLTSLYEKNYCQHAGGDINYYLKHGNSDTLIIGSSRVNTMINPQILGKKIINISKPGKHLYYNIAIIHLLKQYNKLPNKGLILLSIELDDFYIESEQKLINDVYYLKYYYNSNEYIHTKINENSIYEPIKFLFKSYRFNGDNFKLFTNQFQQICDDNINGYYPINGIISKKDYQTNLKEHLNEKRTKINPKTSEEFRRLIYFCKKNNVNISFIIPPSIYGSKNNKLLKAKIENSCQINAVNLYDFSSKSEFRDLKRWADFIHLNAIGSEIYSLKIKEKLKI